MKVLHVCSSDCHGGAARAAYRLHRALLGADVDSRMLVYAKGTLDTTVSASPPYRQGRRELLKKRIDDWRWANFVQATPDLHTLANCSYGFLPLVNEGEHDIVHLHWLGCNTLSIEEIGAIRKPVVWTLHDMWGFCGAEHYVPDVSDARFRRGYHAGNQPFGESGPDLNRWVWQRKRRAWQHPVTVVCPSRWLARCARESLLFGGWPVYHVPNPLDLDIWRPWQKDQARALLGLPAEGPLLLFGAIGGEADPRKGASLLREALHIAFQQGLRNCHVAVLGQAGPVKGSVCPFPTSYLGYLRDDISLIAAYNAADLVVVPSMQENLPQAAVEAQSCGVPVVAFEVGGVPDIIVHRETGYLARPFDASELAAGICWVLESDARARALALCSRENALSNFSYAKVAEGYCEVYAQLLR